MANEQQLERDSEQNITNWYGFVPTDEEEMKCFLQIERNPGEAILYGVSREPIPISFMHLVKENYGKATPVHTENKIWNYLYKECKQYVGPRTKIFINRFDIEEGLASDICQCQFQTMKEIEIEAYFKEQEEKY